MEIEKLKNIITELEDLVESEQDRANENANVIHQLRKRIKVLEEEILKVTSCNCPECGLLWTEPCLLDEDGTFNRFGPGELP